MVEQNFLIKCACEECRCEFATPDGICYECSRGLHVRDREREMERIKPREMGPSKAGVDLNDETAPD